MSQDQNLANVDQAFATVYQRMVQPTFFAKLAGYGIAPNTPEDAEALLAIGHNLFAREQHEQQKQAQASGSFFAKVAQELTGEPVGQAYSDPTWLKLATEQLMGDDEIVGAFRTLEDAAAAAVSQ